MKAIATIVVGIVLLVASNLLCQTAFDMLDAREAAGLAGYGAAPWYWMASFIAGACGLAAMLAGAWVLSSKGEA